MFDRIVNQANDAIIVAEVNPAEGPGFRIIYSNEAFTRLFGYTSDWANRPGCCKARAPVPTRSRKSAASCIGARRSGAGY